jgi:glycosyltransferase involved in cell wall biosynthesis
MRIIVGCSSAPDEGSGILTYAKQLTEELHRCGYELHFVSPAPVDRCWLNVNGIQHFSTSQNERPVPAASELIRYVQTHKIDAIINNDNSLLQSIAPGVACPFVTIGHMGRTTIAALACFRHEWSDYVVAISNDMQQRFVTRYRVPVVKCPIVHSGIMDLGPAHNISADGARPLKAVYVGGYNCQLKGADLVLQAALMPEARWQGIHLDWYGDVPANIKQRLEVCEHVTLHGHVKREQLVDALRGADVILFPSRIEGCPMALLEAMSLGVVPITSNGEGAMRWLVISGEGGYVCDLSRWPSQMLECLAHLRDSRSKLMYMKAATRKRVLDEFQSVKMVSRLLNLVESPTVERKYPSKRFEVLRLHRPVLPAGVKAPLLDRFFFRIGYLRRAGILEI